MKRGMKVSKFKPGQARRQVKHVVWCADGKGAWGVGVAKMDGGKWPVMLFVAHRSATALELTEGVGTTAADLDALITRLTELRAELAA